MPETTETTQPQTPGQALAAAVKAKLAESTGDVRDLVVADLTRAEIDRRVAAVKAVFAKITDKTKELKKAENQGTQNFNAQGEKTGEPSFSKDQAEAMKKLREEIAKLDAALSKAFDGGDFTKVLELAK